MQRIRKHCSTKMFDRKRQEKDLSLFLVDLLICHHIAIQRNSVILNLEKGGSPHVWEVLRLWVLISVFFFFCAVFLNCLHLNCALLLTRYNFMQFFLVEATLIVSLINRALHVKLILDNGRDIFLKYALGTIPNVWMMHGSIFWQKDITGSCKTGRNNFRSKQYQPPHGGDAFSPQNK